MDQAEPELTNRDMAAKVVSLSAPRAAEDIRFDRRELAQILNVYGRQVSAGEWRDYAIAFTREKAVFAILRRTGEAPLYRIEKDPRRSEKQGAYSVIAQGGLVLKRGNDLSRVLKVLEKIRKVVG